jgi:hypothetical protein
LAAEKSGAGEQNWVITGYLLCETNGIQNNKILRHKNHPSSAHGERAQALQINNPTQRHGGNRGLNIQQVIQGIETRCEEKQDKTHGK